MDLEKIRPEDLKQALEILDPEWLNSCSFCSFDTSVNPSSSPAVSSPQGAGYVCEGNENAKYSKENHIPGQ